MKLIAAQIRSTPGDIEKNIARHIDVIHLAARQGANLLLFPELSLTGYEPSLAQTLAMHPGDCRLDKFQALSDQYGMFIAVGAPTKGSQGTEISMISFRPELERMAYSKQHLHADELPFFTAGTQQQVLEHANVTLAPAICYESLQSSHAEQAAASGAQVYLASVAKSEKGVKSAYSHYSMIAKKLSMTVVMANGIGAADDFIAAGQSAVWNRDGELVCSTDALREALAAYDLQTGEGGVISLA